MKRAPETRPDDDKRFTFGLTYDVVQVLVDHGYPMANGHEFVDVQMALFRVLYEETALGTDPPRTS